jgi:hypothetical protein
MITKETVTAIWRIYPTGVTEAEALAHVADFSGVCVVVYLTNKKVFVKGMLANFDLAAKRAFIRAMMAEGIEIIQMERSPERKMPFSRRIDDHHEVLVVDLMRMLERDVPVERRHT